MPAARRRRRFAVAAASLAFAALAAAAQASGARSTGSGEGLCPVLDLVPPLACRTDGGRASGAASASAAASGNPAEQGDGVLRTSTTVRYDPGRIAVTFEPRVSRPRIDAAFARAGVKLEQAIPAIGAYMVGVDPARADEALASLRAEEDVATAGQEVLADALDVVPNDTSWPEQWGLRVTHFPQAWASVAPGSKPVVAVVDTGVDSSHPDLRGAVLPGYDFVHNTANPADDQGHGTAVAGVIAARTDNKEGIAGVCGACVVLPVKVLDANGVGDDSVIAAGIVWAVDHGANVINLSLGGPGTTTALDNAVAYAAGKGVPVLAAAGNSSSTTPFYPAASSKAIGVAGTTESDAPYSWSNSGPWVKFAAPGCNLATVRGGGYGMFCGTSSATPIVAGLAGLALAGTPGVGPQQLEQALAKAAVPMSGFVQYGRIDAPGTLSALRPAAPPPTAPAATTTVLKGTLNARSREQSFTQAIQPGRVTATLVFKGARTLTLTLVPQDPAGETVRAVGLSPLRLERVIRASSVRFVVRGDLTTTTFTLTIVNRGEPAG